MKKIIFSLVCGVLVLVITTGCGDKLTNTNDNKTNENNQSGENIKQEENNNSNIDLSYTYKVPGKNIYVNVPSWDPMELTYEMMTKVYKVQGIKYVAITDVDETVGTLAEAYKTTMDVFKANMYRYHPINDISISSKNTETVNGIEVYKFEGTMNCRASSDVSTNYDAYIIGYSLIIDNNPYLIIGSVQDVKQEKNMINEIKATIETMIKTVRTER